MPTECESDPAWFRKEHPIEVREDISFNAYSLDGEVGIMLDADMADLDVQAGEVAFLFGKSKDELWFMPHFGSFVKVSFDPEEEPVASKLYDQPTGVYRSLSMIQDVRFNVPVYHDALSMIPVAAAGEDAACNGDDAEWEEGDVDE